MNPEHVSEVDKYLQGLPKEEDQTPADIFGQPEKVEKPAPEKEGEPAPRENRAARRNKLQRQLDEEREARIRAEARAEALIESRKDSSGVSDQYEKDLEILYGTENKAAIELHKKILANAMKEAEENALEKYEKKQQEIEARQKESENFIDEKLEDIEDQFGIDVTSNSPAARKARNEFLGLVERLSPKDGSGDITSYADFNEVWGIYQAQSQKSDTIARQKELAGRSMTKSGNGAPAARRPTPGFNGWKQDYGIDQ